MHIEGETEPDSDNIHCTPIVLVSMFGRWCPEGGGGGSGVDRYRGIITVPVGHKFQGKTTITLDSIFSATASSSSSASTSSSH